MIWLAVVVAAYAAIQCLELSAVLARVAGIRCRSAMLGYSLQQSVYMGTRLFLVMLLPLLGFLVDRHVPLQAFKATVFLSFVAATVLGLIVYALSGWLIAYYSAIIERYRGSKGSFLGAFLLIPAAHSSPTRLAGLVEVLRNGAARRLLMLSHLVFVVYSSGIFTSFYLAALWPEYRASLSHMSGIANALAAVLLTFVVDPRISKSIDTSDEHADLLVAALFWGRLLATAISCQILMAIVFHLLG